MYFWICVVVCMYYSVAYCCANKAHWGGALFDNWYASYKANIRHSAVSIISKFSNIISKIVSKIMAKYFPIISK